MNECLAASGDSCGELGPSRYRPVIEVKECRDLLGLQACRGGHVLLEDIALARNREEIEDSATGVVDEHDGEIQLESRRADKRSDVMSERDVADQQRGRDARRGNTEGRCDSP